MNYSGHLKDLTRSFTNRLRTNIITKNNILANIYSKINHLVARADGKLSSIKFVTLRSVR